MGAQVIAAELGLEIFRVDLATTVSKYIGETEKNLDRIFGAAEGSNAILFFDEADALFGKRSEVGDSHDRYANIEVAYLLQKMEGYPGAVILATNFRRNIDDAFVRRLDFVIDFPFPEPEDRIRIWEQGAPARGAARRRHRPHVPEREVQALRRRDPQLLALGRLPGRRRRQPDRDAPPRQGGRVGVRQAGPADARGGLRALPRHHPRRRREDRGARQLVAELSDLARLRRVRDRIDREYAQPLDVEALARDAYMSPGHFSRAFKAAYGESPYSYLMTRRIERAMALLKRGDMSVTEVCFEVGCSSLGTFSTRFTELVGMPPSAYQRDADQTTEGMAPCVAKQVTRPIRNREAPADEPHLAWPPWPSPFTRASSPRTIRTRPWPSTATRSASRSATTSSTTGCTGSPSARPGQPGTSIVLHPPAATPGITDDERRTIAEMMAKGTYAGINLGADDLDGFFERLQANDADIVQEPTDQPYGVRDCAVRDPAGNLIRIQQLT